MVALLVDDQESVLVACDRHADWLRGYVQEDDAVRLIDVLPLVSNGGRPEGDVADPV